MQISLRKRSKSECIFSQNIIEINQETRKFSHWIQNSLYKEIIKNENSIDQVLRDYDNMNIPLVFIPNINLETESSAMKPLHYQIISNISTGKKIENNDQAYQEVYYKQLFFPDSSKEESNSSSFMIDYFTVAFKDSINLLEDEKENLRKFPKSGPLYRSSEFSLHDDCNQLFSKINMEGVFKMEIEESKEINFIDD